MSAVEPLLALADEYVRTHLKRDREILRAAIVEALEDAERYRWLRDPNCPTPEILNFSGEELDAAIDAAKP